MAIHQVSSVTTAAGATVNYRVPFALMTLLFFLWGFLTVWNDLLIPQFKQAFALSYFQAMLVQFAFFGAYAVGAGVYTFISMTAGDPIARIGYKNGVVLGLLIAAFGSILFFPASLLVSYPLFLLALFVIGLGFAVLQIAANPYITILGPERTASSRLNLSQAFNSLGTTIGPIAGGWLIYQVFTSPDAHGAEAVRIPYVILAVVFLILAVAFRFAKLPEFAAGTPPPRGIGALRYPHTVLGMVAIFMYVGGEVSVGSALINFLGSPAIGGMDERTASHFLAFYWGGLMVGRFMGAISLADLSPIRRRLMMIAVPSVAALVVMFISGPKEALPYGLLLAGLLVAFFIGGATPQRMLAIFAASIIVLLTIAMLASGPIAMWAVIGVGLFCSVMWSNIFSLAIEGLGSLKSQAASLLVMAILGGAILPPLQGALADTVGIQASFMVPTIAFAYIVFYGIWGYKIGRKMER